MNRRQRRAAQRAGLQLVAKDDRIPVYEAEGERVVALIGRDQVRFYEGAGNAKVVRDRDGHPVRVRLRNVGDDRELVIHRGNPRRYSHDHETEANPPRVWTMRRLAPADTDADRFVQKVFRASVLDNLKEAA